MTDPDPQDPTTPCPEFCEMHIEGRHVGALELADAKEGYNIYTRPVDYGDGRIGMEVVVAKPDGTQVSRVGIPPEQVDEVALVSDLNRSLVAFENGTPIGDDVGDAQQ